jgi:hypothetical protein
LGDAAYYGMYYRHDYTASLCPRFPHATSSKPPCYRQTGM